MGAILVTAGVLGGRVGILRAFSGDTIADRELGQVDLFHNGANTVDRDVFNQPNQIAFDKSVVPYRLYVADSQNSRILGYHSVAALVTGAPADIVIGQRDLYSGGCNNPVLSQASLCNANGVAVDSAGNLFVADTGNNRVLRFANPFATMKATGMTAGFAANLVLGQGGSFRSNPCNFGGSGPGVANLCVPLAVALDSHNNLLISDSSNNRVLAYLAPLTSTSKAAKVFGQFGSFTTATANKLGVSANSLSTPKGLAVDPISDSLYVADNGNSRVLKFSAPLTSQTASLVFGQTGHFNQNSCNSGGLLNANSLCGSFSTFLGVTVDKLGNVFIADHGNNRVLEFSPPIAANPKANVVFGQPDFTTSTCNLPSPPTAKTLCGPASAGVDSGKNLWVSDAANHRVLGFAFPFGAPPTSAAVVLGQPDAFHDAPNSVDPAGLDNPAGIAVDRSVVPNHLYVADFTNNRVLGYRNVTSFANNQPADLVIGQPDFYSSACNQNAALGKTTLCQPDGLAVDNSGNLFVADYGNNRVLKYAPPFLSGKIANQPATAVFGQAGSFATHNASTTRNGLSGPIGVALDSAGRLYVVDLFNNRVLQFVPPFGTNPFAKIVIGQASFAAGFCNRNGPIGNTTLCAPLGAAVDAAGNLYIADSFNSRVLEYNAPLTTSGVGAAQVFGHLGSFTLHQCNDIATGLNADSLCSPKGVGFDAAGNLYIADSSRDAGTTGYSNTTLPSRQPPSRVAATPRRTGSSDRRIILPRICAISAGRRRAPKACAARPMSPSTAPAIFTSRTITTTGCSSMTCRKQSSLRRIAAPAQGIYA
jgi:sugar lactone lactonase YvrE